MRERSVSVGWGLRAESLLLLTSRGVSESINVKGVINLMYNLQVQPPVLSLSCFLFFHLNDICRFSLISAFGYLSPRQSRITVTVSHVNRTRSDIGEEKNNTNVVKTSTLTSLSQSDRCTTCSQTHSHTEQVSCLKTANAILNESQFSKIHV